MEDGKQRGRWPLYVLAVFLFVWEPLRLAGDITQSLPTIGMRGGLAVAELLAHAVIAAVAVAAARSLWNDADHGPLLATVAVLLSAAASVQSLYLSRLPQHTPPGAHLPFAILAMAHATAWVVYLRWRLRRGAWA
jgi:hypothetical protein